MTGVISHLVVRVNLSMIKQNVDSRITIKHCVNYPNYNHVRIEPFYSSQNNEEREKICLVRKVWEKLEKIRMCA